MSDIEDEITPSFILSVIHNYDSSESGYYILEKYNDNNVLYDIT